MHKVIDTLFAHKASFSQGRYLYPLFPSLDINLLLNHIEKYRHKYMNIITEAYNKNIMNTYDERLYLEPKLSHFFSKIPLLDISYFESWGMLLLSILVQHATTLENTRPHPCFLNKL